MTENNQNSDSQTDFLQSDISAAEEKSAASDATTVDQVGAELDAPADTPAPLETASEANVVPESAAKSDAETKSDRSKTTENKGKTGTKNKEASKKKTAWPRKRAQTESSADESATGEYGDAGTAGHATSASTDEPMTVYLRGCSLDPAPSAPVGTLPPQLAAMFPDMLSVGAVLATTAAVAGQNVKIGAEKGQNDNSLALRIAIVGEDRRLPPAVVPVLEAAYDLERQDVLCWNEEKQKRNLLNAAGVVRHRLYQQTLANAGLLGLAELRDCLNPTITTSSCALPRPRFVLRDPVQNDVTRAFAAAGSGILLVDGRRQPTMAGFGVNYDVRTAAILNSAAAGNPLELADPQLAGCIRMRPVAVSVIGMLSAVDTFSLHKAGPAALAATMFVPVEDGSKFGPTTGAVGTLTEILGRVRALTTVSQDGGSPLRFSAAARKALQQAEMKLSRMSTEVLAPLADYYDTLPDLMRRITIILQLLDQADRQADSMSTEIGKGVVARAAAFIEQSVLPAARNVLAAATVDTDVRDARRVLSYVQQYCSCDDPIVQRRDLVRIFQRSISIPAVDRAIKRLVVDALLIASNSDASKGAGHVFQVDPVVFDPKNQLPDLVTDPRRAKL